MSRRVGIPALFLLVLDLLAPSSFGDRGPWLLRFSGGAAWVAPDDLNVFLRDYLRDMESASGSSARGAGVRTVDRARTLELALFIPVEPRIHLLAGFGVLRAESTGNAFSVTYPAVDASYARDDRIRSVFGRLGAAWSVPVGGRVGLRPYAAAELFWTTFEDEGGWSYTSLDTGEKTLWMDWTVRASAFDPGFSAGLMLDVDVIPPVRLSVDVGYRRARLSGFRGDVHSTWSFPGHSEPEDMSDIPLYYYEYFDEGKGRVCGTMTMPDVWGGRGFTLVRDAVLDLSGPYLRAGVSFGF